jgi:mRNA-degrading endonuclease toxin of MazEF toxin-antitoxin module
MTKRSTPSGTSRPRPNPSPSTTSWTIPKPASVLSYAYLWAHEAERGEVDGRKYRPVVVVIERRLIGDRNELLVVPVTTQPPERAEDAFEVPARVKTHLSLDAVRCWIMATELNRFLWPGPDLRPMERGGERTPVHGFIPQALFDTVLAAVIARAEKGRLRVTKRGE